MQTSSDRFPYITIRLMACAYCRIEIDIVRSDSGSSYPGNIKIINNRLRIELPWSFSAEQKKSIICETVQLLSKERNFRMALVWSAQETIYFSPRGIEQITDKAPSGGKNYKFGRVKIVKKSN